MGLKVVIEPIVIKFDPKRLEEWRLSHDGTVGFGETIVGEYYAQQGYLSM